MGRDFEKHSICRAQAKQRGGPGGESLTGHGIYNSSFSYSSTKRFFTLSCIPAFAAKNSGYRVLRSGFRGYMPPAICYLILHTCYPKNPQTQNP